MLVTLMVVGLFSGVQPFKLQRVMAATIEGLQQINQNGDIDFQVFESDGKINISNKADSGGFNSGGISNASYLITPEKVSGDFSAEVGLTVTSRSYEKTSGVIGVGAFSGTGPDDMLAAAVARGDNGGRSYYQKKDSTYGAGSPNTSGVATTGSAITLKIERVLEKYTVTINEKSHDITGSVNPDSLTADMHLGLVICGAEAQVDTFIIKQGDMTIYDLSAPTIEEPSGPAPIPSGITASIDGNTVALTLKGEELLKGQRYDVFVAKDGENDKIIKSYTHEGFNASEGEVFEHSLTASGSYVFTI